MAKGLGAVLLMFVGLLLTVACGAASEGESLTPPSPTAEESASPIPDAQVESVGLSVSFDPPIPERPELLPLGEPFDTALVVQNNTQLEVEDVVVMLALVGMTVVDTPDPAPVAQSAPLMWKFPEKLGPQQKKLINIRVVPFDSYSYDYSATGQKIVTEEIDAKGGGTGDVARWNLVPSVKSSIEPVLLNSEFTYTLRLEAEGSEPLRNIVVRFELPKEVEFVRAGQDVTVCLPEGLKIQCEALVELTSQQPPRDINITVKAIEPGDAVVSVFIRHDKFATEVLTQEGTIILPFPGPAP